ncbi:fluoride efflux transporter CrcB [Mesorhizobium sp. 1M-11]|uniref:fluoride efflux transporter CrcB n=1 Tax=Mesorhizobium sp. 1M-11 TaxID=1529006 RepID=UPI0006C763BD|nr:fluoride efflux transporter CrcB [Mesorhizobium sp. 1M-11]
MSFTNCLVVMLGGALGTLARYLVSWLALPISGQLPWGTIIINVTGSLLIGFFGTLTLAQGRYPVSEGLRLFVMIGICGGYTTFSSFSLQTLDLLRSGAVFRAAINIAASIALCTAAVAAGHLIASYLNLGEVRIAQTVLEEDA